MRWHDMYTRAKARLLTEPVICSANRELFAQFFEFEEHKLKRQNGLSSLDESCFKTLYGYTQKLRNVNEWFADKPWKDLTREDIRDVYDALEDARIRRRDGKPFEDRASYYNKIFKSKPFRLAGKATLAEEVIEFTTSAPRVVRFVTEETFRTIADTVINPSHCFLLWLAWDIGENVDSLLKLTPRDFTLQVDRASGEREYVVNLPAAKLKRSRQSRSEVTLYPETAHLADAALRDRGPDDLIFGFEYRQALKFLHTAVRRTGATTQPLGERVRWKDLRSGMACHLLRSGWTRDEVNARLGHTPRSAALDAYINFMALDRAAPKQRMRERASPQFAPTLAPQTPRSLDTVQTAVSADVLLSLRDELFARLGEVTQLLAQASPNYSDGSEVMERTRRLSVRR